MGVIVCPEIYKGIQCTLRVPETGGILGADSAGTIVAFHYDTGGVTEENRYIPDVATLNRVIHDWFQSGIRFAGFVHTHRKDVTRLSLADVEYAQTIKKTCQMESVFMLLYIPETDRFYEYIV